MFGLKTLGSVAFFNEKPQTPKDPPIAQGLPKARRRRLSIVPEETGAAQNLDFRKIEYAFAGIRSLHFQ